MEICKQLFDLGQLFEHISDLETVSDSFNAFAEQEIIYRGEGVAGMALTPRNVLQDTIDTCIIIAKRGKGDVGEKEKFIELQKGIKAFNNFLMSGHFRIDHAIAASSRIALLAAKISSGDLTPIAYYNKDRDVSSLNIEHVHWRFLNKLKKLPDKSSFYYWWHTIQLL